jgi:hypothetical protein
LQSSDFTVERDITKIAVRLTSNYNKYEVVVERACNMIPKKSGFYEFRRKCKGRWIIEDVGGEDKIPFRACDVYYMDRDRRKPVTLSLVGDSEAEIASDQFFLQKGQVLTVRLKSIEEIEEQYGFYALTVNSEVKDSRYIWECKSNGTGKRIEALLFGEKFPLRKVQGALDKVTSKEGITFMITWEFGQ